MDYRGPTGPIGISGFSPHLAIVADGERRVLKVADWVGPGAEGDKPNIEVYLSSTGYVTDITLAGDIRDISSLESFVTKASE